MTNAVFQTSVAFVYGASIVLFGEPLTNLRMLGVGLALFGSLMASGVLNAEGTSGVGSVTIEGVALASIAAMGVALYQVCFRFIFGHLKNDVHFIAFFSAWLSIWHVVVVLPMICIASFAGFETLQLPYGFHAVLGTVLSAMIASTVNIL